MQFGKTERRTNARCPSFFTPYLKLNIRSSVLSSKSSKSLIGMATPLLPMMKKLRIFTPFLTAVPDGTGFVSSFCRSISVSNLLGSQIIQLSSGLS